MGRAPWALRIMPIPVATGLAQTWSMPRISRAAQVPTTSTMASTPPTSWKWTCSGGRRWSRPSTSASAAKVACTRSLTRGGRRASSTTPMMWPYVRTTAESSTSTWTLVAATPARSTGSTSIAQPFTGRRSSSDRTSSMSAPASTRLPRAMSPAMPEKQWNQARFIGLGSRRDQVHAGAGG